MLRRALIIDEDAPGRLVLKARLHAACYEVHTADDPGKGQALARQAAVDFIVISEPALPRADLTFPEALRRLAGQGGLPVLALLRDCSPRARLAALLAGASEVLPMDCALPLLLAHIRCLLRHAGCGLAGAEPEAEAAMNGFYETPQPLGGPSRIGLLATQRATTQRWSDMLTPLMGDAQLISFTPSQLFQLRGQVPDVILLSGEPDQLSSGLTLLADLQARQGPEETAILWAVPRQGSDSAASALDLGAEGVLPYCASPAEVATRLRRILTRRRRASRRNAMLQSGLRLALTDPLTGLSNRRHALPALNAMLSRSSQKGESCAVMLLDLDHFKRINDTWGHPCGDAVLKEIARRLRDALGPADLIARYGGEEFLLAMPLSDPDKASDYAEDLLRALSCPPIFPGGHAPGLTVTASIGLAVSPAYACPTDDLLRCADDALLLAKRTGRNRVRLSHQTVRLQAFAGS